MAVARELAELNGCRIICCHSEERTGVPYAAET
jgi:hypothetical protein